MRSSDSRRQCSTGQALLAQGHHNARANITATVSSRSTSCTAGIDHRLANQAHSCISHACSISQQHMSRHPPATADQQPAKLPVANHCTKPHVTTWPGHVIILACLHANTALTQAPRHWLAQPVSWEALPGLLPAADAALTDPLALDTARML